MLPTFNLLATGFSLGNAKVCALASKLAYSQSPTISASSSDTQVVIEDRGEIILISFRGSQEALDFVTDARAWRTHGVHCGFREAIYSVIDGIIDQVAKLPEKPIVVTGHSLGGALAVLCAYQLTLKRVYVHSVYTFGQPRVGDSAFSKEYDSLLGSCTFRLVNGEDIVPRTPGVLAGYRHVGNEVFLTSLGSSTVNPSIISKLASDAYGIWREWRVGKSALLADHAMARYSERLDAL